MHPPPFNPAQDLLSDWLDCTIEARCGCGAATMIPPRLLAARHGNHPVSEVAWRLRCRTCKTPPTQLWLVAGLHRTCHGGADALDWSVEIKPRPGERAATTRPEQLDPMPGPYNPTARRTLPHALSLMCKNCAHLATVDLPGLIAQGRGNVPIRELPFRCSACGGRAFDLMVSGAHLMAGRGESGLDAMRPEK